MNPEDLAGYIEHTVLRPGATEADIRRVCRETIEYGFHAAVISPVWVSVASEELIGRFVSIVSVAGFPFGASRSETKIVEAVRAAIDGASEIDMVAGIGWLQAGEFRKAEDEISQLRRTLPPEVALKVIIEAPLLSLQQQIDATHLVINSGAQFVKTGTGTQGPVTVEQVRTLARAAQNKVQIKAAGGIRTAEQCYELLEAGAARLGSSASVDIMTSLRKH